MHNEIVCRLYHGYFCTWVAMVVFETTTRLGTQRGGSLVATCSPPLLLTRQTRRRRRLQVSEGESTARQAIDVADEIMRLIQHGEYDGIVQYLADQYLTLQDGDLEEEGKGLHSYICPDDQEGDGKFPTNAYTWRGLLFDPPDTWERKSVLHVEKHRCLIRYGITPKLSEEDIIMTVDMRLQDALKPTYRSIQIQPQWFVYGLLGEPGHDDQIALYAAQGYNENCHRRMGPETVAMCQLEDLKNTKIHMAWEWNTKKYKTMYNDDVDAFIQSFKHQNSQILLGHTSATILKSVQTSRFKNMIMVGLESAQRTVFLWMMTLDDDGVWRVDAINRLAH